jgi:hypothetical protein
MPFNLVICTPSSGHCRTSFAFSIARLTGYLATHRPWPELTSWSYDFAMLEGSGISTNRERLTRQALANPDTTHVLWIDDDMGFAADTLHLLARWRQPIVGCNYRTRSPPSEFTALNAAETARIQTTAQSSGLEAAAYTGFGFCLIERKVFEVVPEPRYPLLWSPTLGDYSTEDMPFFEKALAAGFNCYVDHDASKKIWHCGNLNYVWNGDYTGHTEMHGIAPSS